MQFIWHIYMIPTCKQIETFASNYNEYAKHSLNELIVLAAKKKPGKGSFIFPSSHPKVKSGNHFPIDTEARARAALSYAGHHDSHPWYKGTVEELRSAVRRAVKRKYPSIDVSEPKKKSK